MGILAQLEIEFQYDLVDDFISHFSMMCELLEPLIINLEKPAKFSQNINELFRIFHNIKSSASFMKLNPVVKLATITEDILDQARNFSDCTGSDELIDWLLLVSDQLEIYRQDIAKDSHFFSIINPKIIKIPTKLTNNFK